MKALLPSPTSSHSILCIHYSSKSLAHLILSWHLLLIGQKVAHEGFHQILFFFSSDSFLLLVALYSVFCVYTYIDLAHMIIALILSSEYYRTVPHSHFQIHRVVCV